MQAEINCTLKLQGVEFDRFMGLLTKVDRAIKFGTKLVIGNESLSTATSGDENLTTPEVDMLSNLLRILGPVVK